jgi:hypothetical protein
MIDHCLKRCEIKCQSELRITNRMVAKDGLTLKKSINSCASSFENSQSEPSEVLILRSLNNHSFDLNAGSKQGRNLLDLPENLCMELVHLL